MSRGDNIVHLDIFERDEWICHICNTLVDRNLRGDAWMRATLDHVIPLSKGGTHTFDNVKTSHWRCNMLKGDKLTLDCDSDTIVV